VPVITQINTTPITDPTAPQFLTNSTPTLIGQGLADEPVTVQALDGDGNLVLTAGSGTVAHDGSFSVTLTTPLPGSTNFLSVIVGTTSPTDIRVASAMIQVIVAFPFGYVYSTLTN